MPEKWRFECECPPTLETGCAICGNQTITIGLSSMIQITPSPLTVILTEAPGGTTNTGTSPRMRRGALGLRCGTPWRLPSDWSHTNSNGRLAWYWESATPNPNSNPNLKLTLPTQRSGAVPWDSSRLQAEEDIKELACIKSPFQGGENVKLFFIRSD